MREVPSQGVSKQTLQRLPVYLSYLKGLREAPKYISATAIAEALNMNHVVVRKDLASISSSGRPKVGYVREDLIYELEGFLGYDNTQDAVLVGAGQLGKALLAYDGFVEYGLNILAGFDTDPLKAGFWLCGTFPTSTWTCRRESWCKTRTWRFPSPSYPTI